MENVDEAEEKDRLFFHLHQGKSRYMQALNQKLQLPAIQKSTLYCNVDNIYNKLQRKRYIHSNPQSTSKILHQIDSLVNGHRNIILGHVVIDSGENFMILHRVTIQENYNTVF